MSIDIASDLDEQAAALRKVAALAAQRDAAVTALPAAIVRARHAGANQVRLATVAGLSRPTIIKILREAGTIAP